MAKGQKLTFLDILFRVRGSIIRQIAWRVAITTGIACAVVFWTRYHADPLAQLGIAPFTVLGLSISIFMSFRNGACYDRWWEGRKQWGHLLVAVRSLIRETNTLGVGREEFLRNVGGFSHALAARLRDHDEVQAARFWWDDGSIDLTAHPNVTNFILEQAGRQCSLLTERGHISEWRYTVLEAQLVELSSIQAACERLKNTPLPLAYNLLIHRTVYLFCGLLPFGLATYFGWMTPPFVAIISYTFFGLDAIGDELENPFGREQHDLPLDDFTRIVDVEITACLASNFAVGAVSKNVEKAFR